MKILITAGNTQTPIDRVRWITNIFSGRTGATIAVEALRRGHSVTLFTSHPEVVAEQSFGNDRLHVQSYRAFDELNRLMESTIPSGGFNAIVHAAAVSDYSLAGVYAPDAKHGGTLVDVSAGKVKSHHPELWLRLLPTPKLVDRIRSPWGFTGKLVKFKLEVGLTEEELLVVAEKSRVQSGADLMVANTLEEMKNWAYIGPIEGRYVRVSREELASRLIEEIDNCKLQIEDRQWF